MWTSSIDGPLGTGPSFSRSDLSRAPTRSPRRRRTVTASARPPPGRQGLRTGSVLVGAGDIADCREPGDEATAKLLDGTPGTVFTVGDNVYPNGTATEFANCYDPTWGRHKLRTTPAPGNHDYNTPGAAGYYGYFGAAAGPAGLGLLQLRRRRVARRRPEQRMLRASCGRLDAGEVAAGRPGGAPDGLHGRHLAPSAVQLRRPARQRAGDAAVLAGAVRLRRRRRPQRPRAQLRAVRPADARRSRRQRPRHPRVRRSAPGGRESATRFGTPLANSEVRANGRDGRAQADAHADRLRLAVRAVRRARPSPTPAAAPASPTRPTRLRWSTPGPTRR